jgi:hypothetical protein
MISKAQAQVLAFLSARLVGSSGETEKSVRKTHFSRRAGFEHEALPLVDHSHDLEALVASPLSLVKMLKQEGRSRLPVLRGISTTLTRRSSTVSVAPPKVTRRRIADASRWSEVSYACLRFICLQYLSCGR